MKVEVAVLGSPSLISLMISVDVKQRNRTRVSELTSCVKVEVDDPCSPFLIVRTVSMDVKQR